MNIDINKRKIASYALLPGVLPRMRELFGSGFGWFAYMVALVFQAARLLPAHHPYLSMKNKGKYNVFHVIYAAGSNLKFKWQHIDQIAIFAVVISGILLLVSQICLLLYYFAFGTAHAAGLFETVNAESDAAFMLLDYVFGIPGFYGSCALGTPDGQTIYPCTNIPSFGDPVAMPFHAGLHSLLEFYSWSLLFVAVLIFVYYVVIVAAETAQTGVPLGARFNKVWAPIRMCVAIGLLIPVAYGLNSGQYIVLGVAKLGSGLATNAWFVYNDTLATQNANSTPAGEDGTPSLLPKPNIPDTGAFIAALQLVQTCRAAYMKATVNATSPDDQINIHPFVVKPGADAIDLNNFYTVTDSASEKYKELLDYYDKGDVLIRYGRYEEDSNEPSKIVPYCGDIVIPTTVTEPHKDGETEKPEAGAWAVQVGYFKIAHDAWSDKRNRAQATRWVEYVMPDIHRPCSITEDAMTGAEGFSVLKMRTIFEDPEHNLTSGSDPNCNAPPSQRVEDLFSEDYGDKINVIVTTAWEKLKEIENLFELDDEIRIRGWVGAGMWYNKIAEIVGQEMQAATSLPYMQRLPDVMREVRSIKGFEDSSAIGVEIYNPEVGNKEAIENRLKDTGFAIAQVLYQNYANWMEGSFASLDMSILGDTNVIQRVMHGIFGTQGLLEIRDPQNENVHPMALLVGIGKDLVDSTLRNVLAATGFSIAGGLYGAFGDNIHQGFLSAMSRAFTSVAMVGLTAGFLLYYVMPFMPFLYFFFAAGTWVKSIFEAMVGVPLWALAHLRIDGEGLPGDAASNGYFLILEIFIRPILVVFALIASFTIFGAMVRILHEIFGLVVDNLLGHDDDHLNVTFGTYTVTLENKRGIVDEFFFTIIYTFIVYITGLSCFKLIDLVPNSILRWSGGGAKTFGDTTDDPAEGLTQYAAIGGFMMSQRLTTALNEGGKGIGMAAAEVVDAPPDLFSMVGRGGGRSINETMDPLGTRRAARAPDASGE